MTPYIGLLAQSRDAGFNVVFPDFPGCSASGETLAEMRLLAAEALSAHIDVMPLEEEAKLPWPTSVEEIMDNPKHRDAVPLHIEVNLGASFGLFVLTQHFDHAFYRKFALGWQTYESDHRFLEEDNFLPISSEFSSRQLPSYSAVYFIVRPDVVASILYVGKAANLKKRWSNHERFRDAIKVGGALLYWWKIDEYLLAYVERWCINFFRPAWNVSNCGGQRTQSQDERDQQRTAYQDKVKREFEATCDGEKKTSEPRPEIQKAKETPTIRIDLGHEMAVWISDENAKTLPKRQMNKSLKMQTLVCLIGEQLGMKIWLPKSDRQAVLHEWRPKIDVLLDRLPMGFDAATMATIEHIDVLWIQRRSLVRGFAISLQATVHSTILRIADLLALQPMLILKAHIVAPLDQRNEIIKQMSRPVFTALEGGPLIDRCSYVSHERLVAFAKQRHALVNDARLDAWIEPS